MTASLVALLDDHPSAPDDLLLADDDGELTRAQVDAAVDARATELRKAGVVAGDPVAIVLPNRASFVVAMLAIWRVGAVMVPVNVRAPEPERMRMLDAGGAAFVVDAEGVHGRRSGAASVGPDAGDDGAAFVTWTSGTTGAPTPIRHGHAEYLELLDRVLGPLRGAGPAAGASARRPPTPNLVPVALALNAGIYNVLFGRRAGAPVVILDRFEPARFVATVRRYGIRSTVLPPAAIAVLADDDAVTDLGPLRYVRSITAPLSALLAQRFTRRFSVTVLNGYGQAELGEVIGWTAADAREHPDKVGAVGRAHPGVTVTVADPDAAGIGRLLVKPPQRALGRGGDDPLAGRVDAEGFVDTGDLARIDADGFVWIEGRVGDVINRGGNKVFPDAVEEVLRLHPLVVDAAVVAAPDERLGEVPVAYVVATAPVTDDELATWCRTELVPYKVPVAFRRVDTIPRTEVGKIRRAELRAS
ncbi:MAG: class I adenylate-forming enzyme family protein [Acidimicrobiia bacterium]